MTAAFFSIEPIGLGTADVECFPSYLLRLANLHAATVGQLISSVCAHSPSASRATARCLLAARLATLVRPNLTTLRLVRLFTRATRTECGTLRATTFLALRRSLVRSVAAFSHNLRWCPDCFAEHRRDGTTPYFRLIWQLTDVEGCEHHHRPLVECCGMCGALQTCTTARGDCGICAACGAGLDAVSDPRTLGTFCAGDLHDLVEQIALGCRAFPRGGVARFVNQILERAWASGDELRLWRHVPRDLCLRFASPDEVLPLGAARSLAFGLGVPIATLLSGDPTGTSLPLAIDRPNLSKRRVVRHRTRRIRDVTKLRKRLETLLAEEPVPSLRELAARLGASTGALRYHFPNLVAQLVRRRRTETISFVAARERQIRHAVLRHIEMMRDRRELALTKKGVLRALRKTTEFPKNSLRREISRILEALAGEPCIPSEEIQDPQPPKEGHGIAANTRFGKRSS